jgi:hypothetical protein
MQMVGDGNDEEWLKLCQLAAQEHDPKKLRALIAEITRLLAAKEQRLRGNSASARRETETSGA